MFLTLQNVLLLLVIFKYGGRSGGFILSFTVGVVGLGYILISGLAGLPLLAFLQSLSLPLFCVSRIPQIVQNYSAGTTGQQSVITAAMNLAGSSARVFTTLQEVDDIIILAGNLLGVLLNGIILGQIFFYWAATNRALKKKNR